MIVSTCSNPNQWSNSKQNIPIPMNYDSFHHLFSIFHPKKPLKTAPNHSQEAVPKLEYLTAPNGRILRLDCCGPKRLGQDGHGRGGGDGQGRRCDGGREVSGGGSQRGGGFISCVPWRSGNSHGGFLKWG